jgi:hypothetical protein
MIHSISKQLNSLGGFSMFSLNQIVRGKNAGVFVILSFRIGADGERWAMLKELCEVTGKLNRGGLSLPESCLRTY